MTHVYVLISHANRMILGVYTDGRKAREAQAACGGIAACRISHEPILG